MKFIKIPCFKWNSYKKQYIEYKDDIYFNADKIVLVYDVTEDQNDNIKSKIDYVYNHIDFFYSKLTAQQIIELIRGR